MSADRDLPLDWGTADEMNALEALMWRVESDPQLRSPIFVLNVLDEVPSWDRFVAAHEWGTRMVPRFRKHIVDPPLGLGSPYWTMDENFDLNYHVRRLVVPEPGTWTAALRLVEQLAMTPFDRARSPWEVYLLEGLADGRSGYLLKMHHSVMDGTAGAQLFEGLFSRTRESDPAKAQPPVPTDPPVSARHALRRQTAGDLRLAAQAAPLLARWLGRSVRNPSSAGDAARYLASLRRVLAPPDCEPSPILRRRSLSSRFMALEFPFADLRAAGKTAGCTVNDAFVAAQLGAFRRYHEALGSPIRSMPISMPISVRRATDQQGGNRFAGASFAAPVGMADPAGRMRAFSAMVRKARDEVAVDGIGMISPALARFPGPVMAALAGPMTKGNDLQTSSVPFLRHDVFMAGARIVSSYGFGPLPGCAVMGAMVTHGDLCCVGLHVDPAAVTDIDAFSRCLEEGFAEVLSLHPGAAAPSCLA